MAKFNYARSQATASRLLDKFSGERLIVLKRRVPGDGPARNPGAPSWISYQATGVVLPASKGTVEAFDNRLEGGSLIDESLRYVVVSPLMTRLSDEGPETIEPKSTDVVSFDGYDWAVLGCTPLNPGGIAITYPMGVKRLGSNEPDNALMLGGELLMLGDDLLTLGG